MFITNNDKKFYPIWRENNPSKDWLVVNISNITWLEEEQRLRCSDFKLFPKGSYLKKDYVRNYVIVEEY